VSTPTGVQALDRDRLVWMFEQMLRIREFEERVKRTFEEHPGVIRGHTHLADGAEASIVGSIATLGPDDQFFTTYRCHGYPLARGTDPKAMMAEIYGRRDGLCKGIGGSMHLADVSNGFLGTSGIVAAGIPHATGAAWAAQIRRRGQVVLCFFGDGASKQGAFSESLNIASLWKLPIVYVMENNGYNVHTRTEQEDANRAHGEDLSVKARAFSMPGVTIDGRDPVAVYETVGAAVVRARSGEGPTLVESQMYRLSAHGNIIAPPGVPLHFPEHEAIEKFGAPEEYEAAKRGDPVPAFRGRLVGDGTLTAEQADAIAERVRAEMEEAVSFGLASPFPDVEQALEYVYA
jgi:pyruvate dehydrogenase E1 component alpha subunit